MTLFRAGLYSSRMHETPASSQVLPSELLRGLLTAGQIVEERLEAVLSCHGLSLAKMAVLENLAEASDPMPLGTLSERLGCVKSNVTQLVDRLEGDKLVHRVPDAQDRRSIHAALTEAGRQRYLAGRRSLEEIQGQVLGCLSEADRGELARLLRCFGPRVRC